MGNSLPFIHQIYYNNTTLFTARYTNFPNLRPGGQFAYSTVISFLLFTLTPSTLVSLCNGRYNPLQLVGKIVPLTLWTL